MRHNLLNRYNNFQSRVKSNRLLCFYFTSLCDWSRKLSQLSPINQMQNKNQSQLGLLSFLALQAVWLFLLLVLIGS